MATTGGGGGGGLGGQRTTTTHVVVVWCLLSSCWVVSAATGVDDEAGTRSVKSWGVSDQTAVVGRLFELTLPRLEEKNAVLTVSRRVLPFFSRGGGE